MCSFCSEINNVLDEDNLFYNLVTKETDMKNRIIFETQNFVVLPSIGSFVEGYLLIVTKQHYTCIGGISLEMYDELKFLINTCKTLIKEIYDKNSIMFEHGSTSCCTKVGGCVDHAHLHIVPINEDITPEISKFDTKLNLMNSIYDLEEYGKNDLPYLYYQDINNHDYIVDADIIPSQFFRQVICKKLNIIDKWDWRKMYELENLQKTIFMINKNVFTKKYNYLYK